MYQSVEDLSTRIVSLEASVKLILNGQEAPVNVQKTIFDLISESLRGSPTSIISFKASFPS